MKKALAAFAIILLVIAVVVFFLNFRQGDLLGSSTTSTSSGTAEINGHKFTLEVAKSQQAQEKGLSDRTSLAKDKGMLFVFTNPCYCAFWMRHMKFPIDILFIRDNKIVTIYRNVPVPAYSNENPPSYSPGQQINKVLEINAGLSDQYNIKEGDTVKLSL